MSPRSLLVLALVLAAGCGAPLTTPELVRRDLPTVGDVPSRTGTEVEERDPRDASVVVDAGVCCLVDLVLTRLSDEVAATYVEPLSGRRVGMTESDGGVWTARVCLPLQPVAFYFEALVPADPVPGEEDGGLFPTVRVNPHVPAYSGAQVSRVNVFDPGDAGTCQALDAGVYALGSADGG